MRYSLEERCDILEVFHRCHRNAAAARRLFIQIYPERPVPSETTFRKIAAKFRLQKSVADMKRTRQPRIATEEKQLEILLHFQENQRDSLRSAANILNVSKSKIGEVLKKNNFKPYKFLPVQELTPRDRVNRVNFCRTILEMHYMDNNFLRNILWTDESSFSTSGLFNRRNSHVWAAENPKALREIKKQGRQTVNVWCGIIRSEIVGPFFIENVLTGHTYSQLLLGEIENFLDNIPINQRNSLIWQQDGAPPHNARVVVEFLNNRYPTWIGRNGTIPWPPRSPDLNPLDYFLWGALKQKIYDQVVNNRDHLRQLVREEIDILNNSNFYDNVIDNFIKRCNICIQNNGGHVENLL